MTGLGPCIVCGWLSFPVVPERYEVRDRDGQIVRTRAGRRWRHRPKPAHGRVCPHCHARGHVDPYLLNTDGAFFVPPPTPARSIS